MKKPKSPQRAKIGERLEQFRPKGPDGKYLNMSEWAKEIGISRFVLADCLDDRKEIKLLNLQKIFKWLPVSKEWKIWLIEGGPEPDVLMEPETPKKKGR